MKLRSRHSSSRYSRQRHIAKVALIALAVVVVGILLPTFFSAVGRVVLYPLHVTNDWYRTSSARLPMFMREQNELITRITDLENQLAAASGTELTQQRLYEENVWLKGLLGVEGNSRIAAAVIARPGQLPYDMMQIDKGERDGIKVGAPVYIGLDNVIGVITHTTPEYSFIELFTTPNFKATAFISGANVMATIEGHGGGVARVRVPQGVPLAVGNLVHMPSIDPGVFGRIAYLENEPSQPEQFGYITLQKPISGIHYVAVARDVVTPSQPPVIEERVKEIIRQTMVIDVSALSLASTTIIASSTAATP